MMFDRDYSRTLKAHHCGAASVLASGTGDETAVTGTTIDRAVANGRIYLAALVVIDYLAVLSAGQKLDLAVALQESEDGSIWSAAEVLQAKTTVAEGDADTGSTEEGMLEFAVHLSPRKRYFRVNFTPDLDEEDTGEDPVVPADDTALVTAVVVLGGVDLLPTV
jgi:hypothetical protein